MRSPRLCSGGHCSCVYPQCFTIHCTLIHRSGILLRDTAARAHIILGPPGQGTGHWRTLRTKCWCAACLPCVHGLFVSQLTRGFCCVNFVNCLLISAIRINACPQGSPCWCSNMIGTPINTLMTYTSSALLLWLIIPQSLRQEWME